MAASKTVRRYYVGASSPSVDLTFPNGERATVTHGAHIDVPAEFTDYIAGLDVQESEWSETAPKGAEKTKSRGGDD